MWQRLSEDPDAVVVAGEGVGQGQGQLAHFVGPEVAEGVFLDDGLNGLGERKKQVEEDFPFLGFVEQREIHLVGHRRVVAAIDQLKKSARSFFFPIPAYYASFASSCTAKLIL